MVLYPFNQFKMLENYENAEEFSVSRALYQPKSNPKDSCDLDNPVLKLNLTKMKLVEERIKALADFIGPYEILTINCSGKNKGIMEVLPKDCKDSSKIIQVQIERIKYQVQQSSKDMIFEYLRSQNTLLNLNLDNNSINDYDAIKIAESMMHNKSIQSIEFKNNLIGFQGAKALSVALKYNKSLILLNLCGNRIPNEGMQCLSKSICGSRNLEKLDVRNTDFTLQRIKPLLRSTRHNPRLREFKYI